MTTIKEIAKLAGVSRGTVDRVINNRGSVNPKTEKKIKDIISILDYKPNKAALIFNAQRKNFKLGIVIFGINNPFFDDVIKGIESKAKELESFNCSIILEKVANNVESQLQAIDSLIKKGVHGIAITPYNDDKIINKINELFENGIPIVTFNTDVPSSKRIAYVGSNYYESGRTAAGLTSLITNSSSNIAVISGFKNVLCHTNRINGFEDCIKNYPNMNILTKVYNSDDDIESYEVTKKLLLDNPNINSLFLASAGVYGACKAVISLNKHKIIKIIAFDNVPSTEELVQKDIIQAIICQEPFTQGSKPLKILFDYLTTMQLPKKELNYVSIDIRIKENLLSN